MTASQGETMAIVEAKGTNGAEVMGGLGSTVGWWGNSVVTSLTPYQNNSVLIDPHGASSDVELQSSSAMPSISNLVLSYCAKGRRTLT